jgi:2-dehydro-3-deoxyphosphogluconate aldolase/(4S)-4-hydroxy-2-oxoglutarate aldolase
MVSSAADAGADFGLAPFSPRAVLDSAQEMGWPFIPAVATISEANYMLERGLTSLQLFPANLLGGLRFLSAISSVLPQVEFLSSGGVDESNLERYLESSKVFGVWGTWIAPRQLILDGNFEEIRERAFRAMVIAKRSEGAIAK